MAVTRTYAYRIVDGSGKRTKGKIDASNEAAAVAILRQQGSVPLSISETTGTLLPRDFSLPGRGKKVKLRDIAIFARQFAAMSASGVSLLRSLAVLGDQTAQPRLKKAINEVRVDVEGGTSLSGAMEKHDRVFPPLMVALVRVGETGGFLDSVLERIAANLEKDSVLRGKIKSALTYPAVILVSTGFLIAGVLAFVVPTFESMFHQLGGHLPLPTQILVNLSHSLTWSGPLFVVAAMVGTSALRHGLRGSPALRLGVDRVKLKLPVFGPLFVKIALSRFARNLGTLIGAGVPMMQALDAVGGTVGNALIAEVTKDLQAAVREGRPMSAPMHEHAFFPQMFTQMIEVGEESGEISQMLDKVADFYDREVDRATESLTASIEPIMVLLMGGVVGAMVICLYMPMFKVYQHIQGA